MMKKKRTNKIIIKNLISITFLSITFLFSCKTIEVPSVSEVLDYTDKDVQDAELKRIEKLLVSKPVEALWRATLLANPDEINKCAKNVADLCTGYIEEKDFFTAYALYQSLEACNLENLVTITTKKELEKKYFSGVPGLAVSKKVASQKKDVASYVSGTVTVWVDLGIKVQRGMGTAERVIGSGFFIDEKGYIVTNHHVIAELVNPKYEGYGRLYIKLSGDEETRIPAKVIGWDSVHDLALLKSEITPPYVFELGSSAGLKTGDSIFAIGSPLGLESTLTSGVVSSTNRRLFTTGKVMQIDAAVNSGNSGGPCVDKDGRVQAIVFAGIQQYQGLNFAIPVEYLKQDLPMLYYGGERLFPWTGSYGRTLRSGSANFIGLSVEYFMPTSSLARAGMEKGCIIVSINGRNVNTIDDMQDILRDYIPGTILKCGYLDKDGKLMSSLLYLEKRPKAPGYEIYQHDVLQNSMIPLFGMELASASTSSKKVFMITNLISGGIADESGFSVNDPITIGKTQFSPDKTAMYIEFSVRRRKKGYLDMSMGLQTALDSPYYF